MTAQESIQKALGITEKMNASGAALDMLAAVRAYLRQAIEALEHTEEVKTDAV